MASEIDKCVFCKLVTLTRGHHIIPRSKGGNEVVQTCETCEGFIHGQWTHNELRDKFNTVESILETKEFKNFLKWRLKQQSTSIFKSSKNKFRDKHRYH